jgi:hypothetical protein
VWIAAFHRSLRLDLLLAHGLGRLQGEPVAMNGTFTLRIRGTGSDGPTFANQNAEHSNERPDGTVHPPSSAAT